jgi:hypothetical protein
VKGLVWSVALSEIPALIVVYVGFTRHGLASPAHEARVPLFFAAGLALGYGVLIGLRQLGLEV